MASQPRRSSSPIVRPKTDAGLVRRAKALMARDGKLGATAALRGAGVVSDKDIKRLRPMLRAGTAPSAPSVATARSGPAKPKRKVAALAGGGAARKSGIPQRKKIAAISQEPSGSSKSGTVPSPAERRIAATVTSIAAQTEAAHSPDGADGPAKGVANEAAGQDHAASGRNTVSTEPGDAGKSIGKAKSVAQPQAAFNALASPLSAMLQAQFLMGSAALAQQRRIIEATLRQPQVAMVLRQQSWAFEMVMRLAAPNAWIGALRPPGKREN